VTQTVVLHVGAMKTGTSFIQGVLTRNRDALADVGVLWPGETWGDQVRAVGDVRRRLRTPRPEVGDRWDRLVDEVRAWDGPLAVVSMEALAGAQQETVDTVVTSLRPSRVRVVLTLRDLGRTLPAQWQESVQNGHTWAYRDYLAEVLAPRPRRSEAGRHFWGRQGWPEIVDRWGSAADELHLVTVPSPGSRSTVLWERFCQASGLDPAACDTDVRSNEAIGAASAELLRRLNRRAEERGVARDDSVLKRVLAKQVLAGHRSAEPSVVLPREHEAAVSSLSSDLVAGLRERDRPLVGDLDDLLPTFAPPAGAVTDDPSELPVDAVLAAAVHGLLGLAAVSGDGSRRNERGRRTS
jgi:hypothetical protein